MGSSMIFDVLDVMSPFIMSSPARVSITRHGVITAIEQAFHSGARLPTTPTSFCSIVERFRLIIGCLTKNLTASTLRDGLGWWDLAEPEGRARGSGNYRSGFVTTRRKIGNRAGPPSRRVIILRAIRNGPLECLQKCENLSLLFRCKVRKTLTNGRSFPAVSFNGLLDCRCRTIMEERPSETEAP